ncbi:MAG: glycine cleavage system protein T [Deltaproteobacteria bacterium GWC2_56_8]|nr:MAG: glycine cleavage system protein T [Deltaproteobacteria bacterium GWB2_55_19]OGP38498.1 MAG: glycine cleavage system protein T [Deltaproteobacteria bacterium GWC2_56_8]HAO92977.1 glycine cleavage system aminomethyltransferase GcvT [Deltaproteobacteria bacterium]
MLKRTSLYDIHLSLGARIVDFAGWEMPVQYRGVIEEHLAVRTACGIFDVSHMGEVEVSGPRAEEAVRLLMTNDIGRVTDGQCQYTLLCYPHGGVVDDTIVYRFNSERFLFCVNASNTDKAFEWIKGQVSDIALVENLSDEYGQIAIQGPNAASILEDLSDVPPSEIKPFHFVMAELAGGIEAIVSRTGYTGEDGFEIYLTPSEAPELWGALMYSGEEFGIAPVGLGARDTLRLEMGYPLYGHELGEGITPIEANLGKYVKLEGREFIGAEALRAQKASGVKKTLIGLKMKDPGIPRAGYEIAKNGEKIGDVVSGTMSPSLKSGIGTGFVEPAFREPGTEIDVVIRGRAAKAEVVKPPFYKRPY